MLSVLSSHAPIGIEGQVVSVEVDIRRGLPGIEIVGLPDGAVRESRERVRISIRNSGFVFPPERITVNLAPAGLRKEGASFDLPIALGVLAASQQVERPEDGRIMVLGELNLSGRVRPVSGVLSAVGCGHALGLSRFLVPLENLKEARSLGVGSVHGIGSLRQAADIVTALARGETIAQGDPPQERISAFPAPESGDLEEIRGHESLKRSLEVAAAGRHHVLLFGPPGSGKTMAARRLPSLLPELSRQESLEVTRIHSVAGLLGPGAGLIVRPPMRAPHHTASIEGIVGGGRAMRPGEASLAHHGVLFLDETPEFGSNLLQGLREPIEEGWISIARAGSTVRYPAEFQLILACNPCPCGNLGRDEKSCTCTPEEVSRYWRRMGGALLDRIDLRLPLSPVPVDVMASPAPPSGTAERLRRVREAVRVQRLRYQGRPFSCNARIPAAAMESFCPLSMACRKALVDAGRTVCLSSRAFHSVIRVARTIADLEGAAEIAENHVLEAAQYRRYGDGDWFWIRA